MTADKILDVAIMLLEFGHKLSDTTADDEALELLRILRRDADFIVWANKWIPTQAAIPDGAATVKTEQLPQQVQSLFGADRIGKIISLLTILVQVYKTLYPSSPATAPPLQS